MASCFIHLLRSSAGGVGHSWRLVSYIYCGHQPRHQTFMASFFIHLLWSSAGVQDVHAILFHTFIAGISWGTGRSWRLVSYIYCGHQPGHGTFMPYCFIHLLWSSAGALDVHGALFHTFIVVIGWGARRSWCLVISYIYCGHRLKHRRSWRLGSYIYCHHQLGYCSGELQSITAAGHFCQLIV